MGIPLLGMKGIFVILFLFQGAFPGGGTGGFWYWYTARSYGRAHEMRDAFGRAFFGLDSKVLWVAFVTCFVARLLGSDGVCFSAGSYCGGGGITKNCVVRDALGGFDGCQGVVPARR